MNKCDLCLALLSADTKTEVIDILTAAGYWDDLSMWRHFGGIENNYSIISNQQATAPAALVEKLTNAIDAVLLLEWELTRRNGKYDQPPSSPREAHKTFSAFLTGTSRRSPTPSAEH